jgi:hypothetical protein
MDLPSKLKTDLILSTSSNDIVGGMYSDSAIPSSDTNSDFLFNYSYDLPVDWKEYQKINEIQYGIHIYPLRKTILGLLSKTGDEKNPFLFSASDLPNVRGKGETVEDAIEDWKKDFHLKFQDIYYKQHWERTDEEQNLYNAFEKFVDIQEYLHRTPASLKQTGKIINISGSKREIEWLDESRDIVDLAECPEELSHYKVGGYFRADILRKFETRELIKIRSITTTCYRDYTDEEINAFLDSLPTTKELPPSKFWK